MRAGDAGHAAALTGIRPGMTELEAFLLVQQAAMREAGEQVLVYGDFVSGPRTGDKGGPPSTRVIERGDLVLLDFSVVVRGYRGDFANTFVCGMQPDGNQRRLYESCLEALTAGERLVRAGRAAREIDQAVRQSFSAKGLAEHFVSHSGHGLGLGHPDPPYLVPESSDTLLAGEVIAIEPGQYTPGESGMRFEHNYLVTDDGYEVLSHHALQIEQP
jgi:Xaa-Pro dipeptidase